jgi:ABC-type transport system substrate-binding protein
VWNVKLKFEETLADTNPELLKYEHLLTTASFVALKCTSEYFSDRDIRRAMMIGTDMAGIGEAIYGKYDISGFPVYPDTPGVYVPMAERPASAQELFDYDPEKARQMIADAGYPEGFKIEMVCGTTGDYPDMSSLFVGMWEEIGVEVELIPMESAALSQISYTHEYKDCILAGRTTANPIRTFQAIGLPGQIWNRAVYESDRYVELWEEAAQSTDVPKRNALLRELGLFFLEEVAYVPVPHAYALTYTWPWVKNYYGEQDCGYANIAPLMATMWIDEDLKAEMGY